MYVQYLQPSMRLDSESWSPTLDKEKVYLENLG